MDGLLIPVSTSKVPRQDEFLLKVSKSEVSSHQPKHGLAHASTPEEALEILKNEPSYDTLIESLKYLNKRTSTFDLHAPSPLASQLIQVLVSEIVPTFWDVLSEANKNERRSKETSRGENSSLELLRDCLKSVPGLSAITLNLKQLTRLSKSKQKQIGGRNSAEESLKSVLQAVAVLLEEDTFIQDIWEIVSRNASTDASRKALWNELMSLLGGKLVGVIAEAEIVLGSAAKGGNVEGWIADGVQYAKWMARNICSWVNKIATGDVRGWKAVGDLLSRSFRLGHTDSIIEEILRGLLLYRDASPRDTTQLLDNLPSYEQRNFILSAFKMIAKKFLSSETVTIADAQWWTADRKVVAATSQLIATLLAGEEDRRNIVITWLTTSSGAGVGEGIALRRAVITTMATDKNDVETVLEKSLQQFGDQLYIKHVPSMQQEAHAQVLLLAAGHVHRKSPLRLKMMMRAGGHLNVVSNRLGASSSRARFLGMVIAEALSSLVDEGDKRMDFKMDETKTPEALWYKSLVKVHDQCGSLELLQTSTPLKAAQNMSKKRAISVATPKAKPTRPQASKIIAIEEVSDDDDTANSDDDDGLTPYAKPDSDAEDSDEDPTTIVRNKPTAPVYIRDLITYLRDSDNYDKQKLGLQTAASLIRRKANFGTEVSEHAEDLASLLVGIQDKYEIEDFESLRLQGMIAMVVAQPSKMGQWFSKTFFDGDYSISQRASILTTIGLSARELGGYGTADSSLPALGTSFPSKTLPGATHARFTPLPPSTSSALKPIDSLTYQLQTTYLAPLATSIADKSNGPDVLKLQPFSSRLKSRPRAPVKVKTNTLALAISSSFFFPLTGRFFIHFKAYGSSKSSNIIFQPHLLSHFLKTLAVLVHASGPSTLALPQMTSEFWDLLLSLRTQAVGDVAVLEALLFAVLTLLEINEDQRGLVEENGGRLLETQSWVESVFSRLSGDGEEEGRLKMCAAGVLVRIREVVEKYQALLLGDMVRFDS